MSRPAVRIALLVLVLAVAAAADASSGGWRTVGWVPIALILVAGLVVVAVTGRRRS